MAGDQVRDCGSDQALTKRLLDAAHAAKVDTFVKAVVDSGFDLMKAQKALGWPKLECREIALLPQVVTEIERLRRRVRFELDMSEERLLEEVGLIAFVDPIDVFYPDGTMKPLDQIPERARRAIVEITRTNGKDSETIKAKMASKLDALKMLGSYFGTFIDRREVNGNVSISLSAVAQEFAGRGAPPPVAKYMADPDPAIIGEAKEVVAETVAADSDEGDFLS